MAPVQNDMQIQSDLLCDFVENSSSQNRRNSDRKGPSTSNKYGQSLGILRADIYTTPGNLNKLRHFEGESTGQIKVILEVLSKRQNMSRVAPKDEHRYTKLKTRVKRSSSLPEIKTKMVIVS